LLFKSLQILDVLAPEEKLRIAHSDETVIVEKNLTASGRGMDFCQSVDFHHAL